MSWSNREWVIEKLKKDGNNLEYACEEFKNDKEIVLLALKVNPDAIQFVSQSFKIDKEFFILGVKQNAFLLCYASEIFKNDREIVIAAIRRNFYAFWHASERLRNNQKIIYMAIKNYYSVLGSISTCISESVLNNPKIAMIILLKQRYAIFSMSKQLKSDRTLSLFIKKNKILKKGYIL